MNDISVDGSPVSDSLEKENNRGLYWLLMSVRYSWLRGPGKQCLTCHQVHRVQKFTKIKSLTVLLTCIWSENSQSNFQYFNKTNMCIRTQYNINNKQPIIFNSNCTLKHLNDLTAQAVFSLTLMESFSSKISVKFLIVDKADHFCLFTQVLI